jgi:hypothetical protein
MTNCTLSNCSVDDFVLGGPGFGAFLVVILLIVLIVFILDILTIIALCLSQSVAKILRIFLVNILVAGLCVASIGVGFSLSGLILNFSTLSPPDLGLCRFLVWGYSVGAIARLYCVAGFSIVVLLIVQYNKKNYGIVFISLFLMVLWVIPIVLNTHILVPPIYAVQYYDNVACFPRTLDADIIKEARYVFTGIWVIFGGIVPLVVSIVIPIVVLRYVKRNTLTGEGSYNKGIAKLALFLVAGNLFNVLGQAVVAFIVYISEPPGVYLSFLAGLLSLIPTPAMILGFMKPVRSKLCVLLCCMKPKPLATSVEKTGSTAAEHSTHL